MQFIFMEEIIKFKYSNYENKVWMWLPLTLLLDYWIIRHYQIASAFRLSDIVWIRLSLNFPHPLWFTVEFYSKSQNFPRTENALQSSHFTVAFLLRWCAILNNCHDVTIWTLLLAISLDSTVEAQTSYLPFPLHIFRPENFTLQKTCDKNCFAT